MIDLNLLPSELEEDLRSSVRSFLGSRCQPTAVTAMYDGDRSLVETLWKPLAKDLGVAGLLVPESLGGSGASALEASVVLEEFGRSAAPVPFLTSAVIATTALLGSGSPLLEDLADGTLTASLAVPWSMAPDDRVVTVRVDGERLTGAVTSVAGAIEADVLIVPVATQTGLALYSVPASEVTLSPRVCLDMSRQLSDVSLHRAAGTLVLEDGEIAVQRALEVGAGLIASEQVGIARWCLETTVAYLKERRQFGRVVGGFQALKHRLADLYASIESADATARYAAATLAAGDADAAIAAAVAKAHCSDVAVHVAEETIQLHAGIGMTWEHPAHLYLKRAKSDQIALGTPGRHRTALASLIDLPC